MPLPSLLSRLSVLSALMLLGPLPAQAQALDYEYFKTRVQPIFLEKRAGHTRCIVCHSERSNNAFRLEKLSPGARAWNEEQSRRNFEMVSRLVVPGDPQAGLLLTHPLAPEAGGDAYHSGGRQFASREDPAWKALSRWAAAGAKAN
jgi:hypothetical protein